MKARWIKVVSALLCVALLASTVAYNFSSIQDLSSTKTAGVSFLNNSDTGAKETIVDTVEDAAKVLGDEVGKTESVDNEVYPLVIIPGMGMSRVSVFDEDGNRLKNEDGTDFQHWTVFPNIEIDSSIASLIWPAVKTLVCQKNMGLIESAQKWATDNLLKYVRRDKNGDMYENVQPLRFEYPLSQYSEDDRGFLFRMLPIEYYTDLAGEDNVYVYNYGAFSNTYNEAAGLNDFIELVKSQSGMDKVNLLPVSLGGTVASAYFDEYAENNDVYKVVNVVAANDGSDLLADVFMLEFNDKSAELLYTSVLPEIIGGAAGYLVNVALRILPQSVLREIIDEVMGTIVQEVMITTPSMWALVPSSRYQKLADHYLVGEEYASLRALTDRYHKAQSTQQERYYELEEKYGVEVYNICGYNLGFGKGWDRDYQYFQFFKSSPITNSDGIIQISSTGMGTSYVPAGTSFPAGYTSVNTVCDNPNHNHISPDRSIDASSCFFPERTWFFEGQHHEIAYNDVAVSLACKIAAQDDIKDVYSDPDYPQFNGNRYVKKLVRDYVPKAEAIDRSTLTPELADELDAALEEVYALYEDTMCDPDKADAVVDKLYKVLVKAGVLDEPEEETFWSKLAVVLTKFVSEVLYKVFGPKGFSEVCRGIGESAFEAILGIIGALK